MARARLWERQKGESESAYAAFLIYRDLGPNRTLELAAEWQADDANPNGTKTVPISGLKKFSAKWDWVERCRAWDNHLQAERDRVMAKEAAKVERRRIDGLEKIWEDAQACRQRARDLAKFPVATRKVEADGKTTIIRPGLGIGREMVALFHKAAELEGIYFDAMAQDPAQMSDAEQEAIEREAFGV